MTQDDRPKLGDLPAALGLLSRLPVPVNADAAQARGAAAAWAYPLAGLAIGAFAALTADVALRLGLPATLAAGLTLAALVILTGAMHEDGLADAADGLWGGWTKDRRLEIMKDSHIGVYGVVAVALGLGLRWHALALILAAGAYWPALLAVAALSRGAMVPVMATLPHARPTGLSHSVGRPTRHTAVVAVALAALTAVVFWQISALWLICVAGFATLACALIARAKIGGQTGDILGATQQMVELTLLLTLAVQLS